jgi:hypothetical protein
MIHIAAVDQAFLLVLIVLCLGSCLVRVFWELEQVRSRHIAPPPQRSSKKG